MFIFRIFFNLIGLVTRLGAGLLVFPIFLLTRNLFLVVIAALVLMVYLYFKSDDMATRADRNANPTTMVTDQQGNPIQIATPVRRVEDGNSAFANDLYAQMTEPERNYYSQQFFWAMGSMPDGQTHRWQHIDIAGTLRPDSSFANKAGERCRRFSEVLKVHAVQQTISGLACENHSGGWCKLSTNATPACGLSRKPGAFDGISSSFRKLF